MKAFPSIRIEGGLLGPDILERLLAGELPGQQPTDFGLAGRRSLTDEIASTFADARALWGVFRHRLERLPESDPGTSLTRDAWVIPFLGLLGYELRYNSRPYEVDGLTFAISHRAGEAEDAPPVHIVGVRQELGRLASAGHPRRAPHSLVQEFLNHTEQLWGEQYWGIVTNGYTLRLLRDSTYIRRQAYVEFDLAAILDEQHFEDFVALYRLLHRTRLPRTAADANNCLLEVYYRYNLEQGGRVRDGLRDGVQECIKRLANGFLAHPKNSDLRRRIASSGTASSEQRAQEASSEQRAQEASSEQRAASSEQRAASSEQRAASSEQRAASSEGDIPLAARRSPLAETAARRSPLAETAARRSPLAETAAHHSPLAETAARPSPLAEHPTGAPLSPEEFYRQLLRLVYRFLFLLVCEDRGLIGSNRLYKEHYSISRLRRLVDNRSAYNDYPDIWHSLCVLWQLFSRDDSVQQLGGKPFASVMDLPVLNGELFDHLVFDDFVISNRDFLDAFWHLVYFRETENAPPRRVNYAALDVEELGSVYESLLEYHPVVLASSEQRAASSEQRAQEASSEQRAASSGHTTANSEWRVANRVQFDLIFGSERRSTGSYYTPPALVAELIRSALEPVMAERLASSERRAASSNASELTPEEKQYVYLASSERRAASSNASELTPEEKQYVYSVVSRPASVAERHGLSRASLPTDQAVSQGGTLRADLTNPSSGDIHSSQHRGRMGATDDRGVPPVPAQRPGQPAGTGNPSSAGTSVEPGNQRPDSTSAGKVRGAGAPTDQPSAQPFSEEAFLRIWQSLPLAARRSLLAEYSLLSIRVLDPACGSGHFLLAAARRLGKELAKIRTGQEEPAPERVREAIRDVVGHCIYGVDKNPLAVELCRVALWLEAHCEGKPLTFLDHRIKCGDSLVGVMDLDVLKEGIPDEAFAPVSGDDRQVARSLKKRNQDQRAGQRELDFDGAVQSEPAQDSLRVLLETPDDKPEQIRQKAQALHQWEQQTERLRMACHLWTTAFFQKFLPAPSARGTATEGFITTETVRRYLESRTAHGQAVGLARALAQENRFFHWPLEFPEVFIASSEQPAQEASSEQRAQEASSEQPAASSEQPAASSEEATPLATRYSPLAETATHHSPLAEHAGFDVVIGNPPFMGGLKISGKLGDKYRRWLEVALEPYGGTADLCATFYRRAYSLLRTGGRMGMVATNTIGQGDTRESGLAVILREGGAITFAKRFIKWPGAANVEVNLVAIRKRAASSEQRAVLPILDGQPIPFISSRLDSEPEAEPKRLKQNEGKAFQGDIVRGIGFVLEPEEVEALVAKDPRNADCLFPYLNGEDLNSHPEQKPSRYVICFHDWDLEEAQQYPDLLRIVEERVKPERERLRGPGDKRNREYWWQFGAYRAGLRQAIAPLQRVLVRALTSSWHVMTFLPNGLIYDQTVIIFAFEDDYRFCLLQSNVHAVYAEWQGPTLESRNRYTVADCFDTFPFPPLEYERLASGKWQLEEMPQAFQQAAQVGAAYHEHRRQIMLARQLGLTKTYNLFHDSACQDADIVRLRELHAAMDRAILACYGWEDLEPSHNFYQNDRGQTRYTISPDARRELLARLVELNLTVNKEGG